MTSVRRATLSDVAELAGVSATTASYILNGRSDEMRIAVATQERVRRAAVDLNYRPNPSARNLRTATTHTVGVITDLVAGGPFASQMITGASVAARSAGPRDPDRRVPGRPRARGAADRRDARPPRRRDRLRQGRHRADRRPRRAAQPAGRPAQLRRPVGEPAGGRARRVRRRPVRGRPPCSPAGSARGIHVVGERPLGGRDRRPAALRRDPRRAPGGRFRRGLGDHVRLVRARGRSRRCPRSSAPARCRRPGSSA